MGVTLSAGDPESTGVGPVADRYAQPEESFYRLEEDRLVPGPLCGGPWDPEHQHGGAVSGILAHLVELVPTATPMRFCRHTVELMRGAPMRALTPEVEILRDGRRLQVVRASLFDDSTEVARATSVRMRVADSPNPVDVDLTAHVDDEPPPFPAEPQPFFSMPGIGVPGFLRAVELRRSGGGYLTGAPGILWLRMHCRVVEGVDPSPFVLLATVGDMLSMAAQYLDPEKWMTINPDLTIQTFRDPVGEWIGLLGLHKNDSDGIGMSEAVLYDASGRIGRGTSSILIEARRPGSGGNP